MSTTEEFRKLIDFAIREEQKAQQTFKTMAGKARDPFVKAILKALYDEECSHEEKLQNLLATVDLAPSKPRKVEKTYRVRRA